MRIRQRPVPADVVTLLVAAAIVTWWCASTEAQDVAECLRRIDRVAGLSNGGLPVISAENPLNVTQVDFEGHYPVRAADLACLTGFADLDTLEVNQSRLRGPDLEPLRQLKKLSVLRIREGLPIDNTGFAIFCDLPSLSLLDLDQLDLDGFDHRQIRGLTDLVCFNCKTVLVDDRDGFFEALADLPNIRYLRLGNTRCDDGNLRTLGRLTDMTVLVLPGSDVTGAGLTAVEGMQELEVLSLSGSKLTNQHVVNWTPPESLRRVDVSHTDVGVEGAAVLLGLPNLQLLDLSGCRLTELPTIPVATNCCTLRLAHLPVDDEDVISISPQVGIKELDLSATQITDACMSAFGEWSKLESLDVSSTAITNRGLDDLLTRLPPSLTNLNVRGTEVTYERLIQWERRLRERVEIESVLDEMTYRERILFIDWLEESQQPN